jgi:hypothetical protein
VGATRRVCSQRLILPAMYLEVVSALYTAPEAASGSPRSKMSTLAADPIRLRLCKYTIALLPPFDAPSPPRRRRG